LALFSRRPHQRVESSRDCRRLKTCTEAVFLRQASKGGLIVNAHLATDPNSSH
jgi:hypothetical protein